MLYYIISEGRIEGEILILGHYESEYNWEDENESKVRLSHGLEVFNICYSIAEAINIERRLQEMLNTENPWLIIIIRCITVMILSFWTDRPGQTVQTQIREEQSDQILHCLQFHLHLLEALLYGKASLFEF